MAHYEAVQDVPHDFSLYWGFGSPLEVLEDRRLLAEIANLKVRSRMPEPFAMAGSPQKDSVAATCWALPHSSREFALSNRRARPDTAPASGRKSISPPRLGRPATLSACASPPTSGLKPQQAARVKRMQKLQRSRAAGARELEQRWITADRVVAARRAGAQADAQARVGQWVDKRDKGASIVTNLALARTHALEELLRMKEAHRAPVTDLSLAHPRAGPSRRAQRFLARAAVAHQATAA